MLISNTTLVTFNRSFYEENFKTISRTFRHFFYFQPRLSCMGISNGDGILFCIHRIYHGICVVPGSVIDR